MVYVKQAVTSSCVSWKVALIGDYSVLVAFQGSTPEVLLNHGQWMKQRVTTQCDLKFRSHGVSPNYFSDDDNASRTPRYRRQNMEQVIQLWLTWLAFCRYPSYPGQKPVVNEHFLPYGGIMPWKRHRILLGASRNGGLEIHAEKTNYST
jgi:hypothetical protein